MLSVLTFLPNLIAKVLLSTLLTYVIVFSCCASSTYAVWKYGPLKLLADILTRIKYNPLKGARKKFDEFGVEAREDFVTAFEKF